MRVGGIAFRAQDVPTALNGFGFLAARGQGVRILGALYTSTVFPEQAPGGCVYLRVFLGGTTDPFALELSESDALAVVRRDLATTLGITAAPISYHEHLWQRAIPQYTVGHAALLRQIDVRLASLSRLALTGNAYRGVGVADSVRDAGVQIDRLVDEGNE
jgi:oxygen-dependent protoporphyrinogen oxidase